MTDSVTQMPILLRGLAGFNYQISKFARNLAGWLLAVMVVMILSQVFFRYVLNDSLPWTEELAKYLMVWVACLVAPWVYRENLNVSIEMFINAMPRLFHLIAELVITFMVIGISALFFRESIDFWQGGLSISASSMPVKLALFYSCAPFAFAMLFLIGIERGWLQLMQLISLAQKEEEECL